MPDDAASMPDEPRAKFLAMTRQALAANTFVELALSKYRGPEIELARVLARRLTIRGEDRLSFVYHYKTRDVTKHDTIETGLTMIEQLLGDPFRGARLSTLTNDVAISFSRKGRATLDSHRATGTRTPSTRHDRDKARFLDPSEPFLTALGVTDSDHRVLPSMTRKWKQIDKFLEVFHQAFATSRISRENTVRIVDFGAGKGYLTFAVHRYLNGALGVPTDVTGIELREDLVRFCNRVAGDLGLDSLRFRRGDLDSVDPGTIHVMIALHACDTATDRALHMGIRADAAMIMCAPCCHKQLRPQMHAPPPLQAMLQFGVHAAQEAEMVTDALRALLLEAYGYRAQVFEFVSLEHTSKNKMLLAVKHARPVDRDAILEQVRSLKAFYGIDRHALEDLLDTSPTAPSDRVA